MNELINLVDDLKKDLDNTKEVKELLELKEEILSNELFNKFKDKEINLNILIMSINKELKKIKGDKNCSL